jgi:hypothetical protein
MLRILANAAPGAVGAGAWVLLYQYLPDSTYEHRELLHYLVPTLAAVVAVLVVLVARSAIEDRPDAAQNENGRTTQIVVDHLLSASVAGLSDELIDDPSSGVYGWPHFLAVPPEHGQSVSGLGSAYAIRLLLLSREPRLDLIEPAANTLLRMQLEGGGWSSASQGAIARPEVTAFIAATLRRAGLASQAESLLPLLDRSISPEVDPVGMWRTIVVTSTLSGALELDASAPLIRRLVDLLCEGAVGGRTDEYHWAASLRASEAQRMAGSVAHTARVIVALGRCADFGALPKERADLVEGGLRWLRANADYASSAEELIRFVDGRRESIVVKHFTAAWVARVFSGFGDASDERIRAEAAAVVMRCRQGIWWRWDTGEYPIWMSYQALAALLRAAAIPLQT